jgi:UDPglucose 6-dehydrogenase
VRCRDFLHPDRIAVGAETPDAAERVAALYSRLGAPTVLTDTASAEMIKYAANAFLAMKLSTSTRSPNCASGSAPTSTTSPRASGTTAASATRSCPGSGWGGSCLPKDTAALLQVAESADIEFRLLRAAIDTNTRQYQRMADKVPTAVSGRRTGSLSHWLGLVGLTVKAGTDDLRDSPHWPSPPSFARPGADFMPSTRPSPRTRRAPPRCPCSCCTTPTWSPKTPTPSCSSPSGRSSGALAWSRIAGLTRNPVVVDTHNLLDRDVLRRAGCTLLGVGHRRP